MVLLAYHVKIAMYKLQGSNPLLVTFICIQFTILTHQTFNLEEEGHCMEYNISVIQATMYLSDIICNICFNSTIIK